MSPRTVADANKPCFDSAGPSASARVSLSEGSDPLEFSGLHVLVTEADGAHCGHCLGPWQLDTGEERSEHSAPDQPHERTHQARNVIRIRCLQQKPCGGDVGVAWPDAGTLPIDHDRSAV